MPLEWSGGWLFEQMARLDAEDPQEWWKRPIGFYDDEGDEEWLGGGDVAPPAGWERLPMHEEVSDGE